MKKIKHRRSPIRRKPIKHAKGPSTPPEWAHLKAEDIGEITITDMPGGPQKIRFVKPEVYKDEALVELRSLPADIRSELADLSRRTEGDGLPDADEARWLEIVQKHNISIQALMWLRHSDEERSPE